MVTYCLDRWPFNTESGIDQLIVFFKKKCVKMCKCSIKCVIIYFYIHYVWFYNNFDRCKGRLAIPAKYREQLKSQNEKSIVVTRDPQYPALKIYPGSIWKHISTELQSLQGLDPIVRNLQWTILGNASESSFDPKGRMLLLLPLELRSMQKLKKQKKSP